MKLKFQEITSENNEKYRKCFFENKTNSDSSTRLLQKRDFWCACILECKLEATLFAGKKSLSHWRPADYTSKQKNPVSKRLWNFWRFPDRSVLLQMMVWFDFSSSRTVFYELKFQEIYYRATHILQKILKCMFSKHLHNVRETLPLFILFEAPLCEWEKKIILLRHKSYRDVIWQWVHAEKVFGKIRHDKLFNAHDGQVSPTLYFGKLSCFYKFS